MLRLLDLFSGIGGFSLAARWTGEFETTQFVEIDPYCQTILEKNFSGVPIHADIRTFTASPNTWDVITCSFPCQDLSKANTKGQGLAGSRSGLWFEALRIIQEAKPRYVVIENVPSTVQRNWLRPVLEGINDIGFDAEWDTVSAADVGAAHLRRRHWVVAYPSSVGFQTSELQDREFRELAYAQARSRLEGRGEHTEHLGGRAIRIPISRALRSLDGIPSKLDRSRIKALGNAVVPQVAMIPLSRVLYINRKMLQITNETTAIVSAHDVPFTSTIESETQPAIAPQDRQKEYKNLLARIVDSVEHTVYWGQNLARELAQMKESKLYEVEYKTWDDFCRNLQAPGFEGKSGRYANMLIADARRKEEWVNSPLLTPIIDSVLRLPEGVTRQIAKAPEEKQPEIVSKLIQEGQPSMKRAKQLVGEDSTPTLEWLIAQWSSVGEVTRIPKYPNGFHVCNRALPWIDWDFQSRASAWKIWQEKGAEYRKAVNLFKRRQEAAAIAEADKPADPPLAVEAVVVEPCSCFDCRHHERNLTDGFDCKAQSFTMALGDDYGPDCRHWKHDDRTLFEVSEFSLKGKTWAKSGKIERPFKQELDLLGLVLDSLADERAMLEESGKVGAGQPVAERIAHIGRTLTELIAG